MDRHSSRPAPQKLNKKMLDFNKQLYMFTFNDLVEGLKEVFPVLNDATALPQKGNTEPDRALFLGKVCYSLREAEQAFGVSHKTMCQWKKTWMAPAWQTEGRKVRLDYDYAILLMERRKKFAE